MLTEHQLDRVKLPSQFVIPRVLEQNQVLLNFVSAMINDNLSTLNVYWIAAAVVVVVCVSVVVIIGVSVDLSWNVEFLKKKLDNIIDTFSKYFCFTPSFFFDQIIDMILEKTKKNINGS
jgi:hypothetical protein